MTRFVPPVLEVDNLSVEFVTRRGVTRVTRGVSFTVRAGRTVALLGESGCGKSVTGRAILNLIDPPGRIAEGRITLAARPPQRMDALDLLKLPAEGGVMNSVRWAEIAMIFQEPRSSLTPAHTVGHQIEEVLRHHLCLGRGAARERALSLLRQVGIPAAESRLDAYPHQLSGGMCQRVMIAMALACEPRLLIADEPTTALDVTIQAQVLDVLRRAQQAAGMAILLITHDMGVVAEMADEVVVMYLGRVMEHGPVMEIFDNPRHPYTQALFASAPNPAIPRGAPLPAIPGFVPDPANAPAGCPFRGRCQSEMPVCAQAAPPAFDCGGGHGSACWLAAPEGAEGAAREANA